MTDGKVENKNILGDYTPDPHFEGEEW